MPEMKIKPAFRLEQIVYLKTDPEQMPYMVLAIVVHAAGSFTYRVRTADYEPTEVCFAELTEEPTKDLFS